MNEFGKEMLEKKTTPSTGGLEATQELKDYLGTLKCPICGSGKLVFGTKAFSPVQGNQAVTGAIVAGGIGSIIGRLGDKLAQSHKMVLEVGCVECGLMSSLQDWKTAKPLDVSSEVDAEELEKLRMRFNELAGKLMASKDKNEKQSIKEERERIEKEMNTLRYKLDSKK